MLNFVLQILPPAWRRPARQALLMIMGVWSVVVVPANFLAMVSDLKVSVALWQSAYDWALSLRPALAFVHDALEPVIDIFRQVAVPVRGWLLSQFRVGLPLFVVHLLLMLTLTLPSLWRYTLTSGTAASSMARILDLSIDLVRITRAAYSGLAQPYWRSILRDMESKSKSYHEVPLGTIVTLRRELSSRREQVWADMERAARKDSAAKTPTREFVFKLVDDLLAHIGRFVTDLRARRFAYRVLVMSAMLSLVGVAMVLVDHFYYNA